jgi:uncharacterized protein DUF1302
MRFRVCSSDCVSAGAGKLAGVVATALFVMGLSATCVLAGDVSAQPANSLNVLNSATNVLPQAEGAGAPASAESGGLSDLHVSGYGSQTFGMWQNPTTLKQYTHSRNNLAVARTLLQIDENYRLNENNTFFMREWFVYEPPYSFDSANANPHNTGNYLYTDAAHASFGHFANGYYNTYEVRDAWWENKTGPLTTFIGNQIVVWGQSLAFRVGDVVNPANTCWAFGFANLEQSRTAQWMVHPILNLPEIGPLSSNFLELIVQPGFAPNWQPDQYGDPYHKYREPVTAGRALPCLPSGSHGPSMRFDIGYDSHAFFGGNAPLITGAFVSQPASREFMLCGPGTTGAGPIVNAIGFSGLVVRGFNNMPKGLIKPCHLGLNKGNNLISPIGDGAAVDTGFWRVPGMQPENWSEGVRFHTLIGATEWTALYYNDAVSGGAPWSLRWTPYTNLWNYSLYEFQEAGLTADRPVPMPSSLAEHLPFVGRAEMIYVNHQNFESNKPFDLEGQRYSDVVKWMAALDLDQAYAPWLTSTGNLSANVEVEDQIVMDNCKLCFFGNDLGTEHQLKNDVNALFNVGTSWWWEDFAPTWTMIFNPKGRTFALFPSLVLNPPWTKKYFLKLQAIEILGGDNEAGIGLFKGQSYLIAQFQYNFNLM